MNCDALSPALSRKQSLQQDQGDHLVYSQISGRKFSLDDAIEPISIASSPPKTNPEGDDVSTERKNLPMAAFAGLGASTSELQSSERKTSFDSY